MQELKRANIYKVAELANVSAMTVTRTFNNSGPVAAKTKAKILKIAAELGYRPNIMAKSLRSGKTNSIGLLWSLSGPHDSLRVVRNISINLMREGYACHIADSLSDPKIIKHCLRDFCARNVDGIIIQLDEGLAQNEEIRNLLGQISNVVIVVPSTIDFGKDVLVLDRKQSVRDIVDHFAAKGRKKIVYFNSTERMSDNAFLEQLKLHGLCTLDKHVFHLTGRWLEKEQLIGDVFLDTLQQASGGKITFDAVITSCDEGAVALTNYFIEKGYKVPGDVAVAGFNDSSMASYLRPQLASVNRCDAELAETVTGMLMKRIKNPKMGKQRKLIEMKFVYRESAG